MYGLKSMSSDHTEVEDLIKVLIPLLSQHTERLSSQELSNSMYGTSKDACLCLIIFFLMSCFFRISRAQQHEKCCFRVSFTYHQASTVQSIHTGSSRSRK